MHLRALAWILVGVPLGVLLAWGGPKVFHGAASVDEVTRGRLASEKRRNGCGNWASPDARARTLADKPNEYPAGSATWSRNLWQPDVERALRSVQPKGRR